MTQPDPHTGRHGEGGGAAVEGDPMEIRVASLSQPGIAPWISAFTVPGIKESRVWAIDTNAKS